MENEDNKPNNMGNPEESQAILREIMPTNESIITTWGVTDQALAEWSLEEMISAYGNFSTMKNVSSWMLARLAYAAHESFGAEGLGQFAVEVGWSKSHADQSRWVYSVYKELPLSMSEVLAKPFTFFVVAAGTQDPLAWINKAIDGNWTVEKLKYEISLESNKSSGETDSAPKPKILKIPLKEQKIYVVIDLDQAPKIKVNDEGIYEGEISTRPLDDAGAMMEVAIEGEVVEDSDEVL